MDHSTQLPPFDVAFAGLYASSIEQIYQDYISEQPSTYRGMSVKTRNTQFPVYNNQPDIQHSNDFFFNPLNKYNIDSPILDNPADFIGTDISDIPQSLLDEYVPWNSDHDTDIDAQSSTAIYSDPEYQLTNTHAAHSGPPDLPPVAVVNPPDQTTSDNQTPHAEEGIAEGNSSIIVRSKMRHQSDTDYAERQRKKRRERYQNNPAYTERQRQHARERRKNPDYAKRQKERRMERLKDPAFKEREKERLRKLEKDPAFVERRRKRKRERYQNNTACAERQKQQQKERYQNDPVYAERKRMIERERHKNNSS